MLPLVVTENTNQLSKDVFETVPENRNDASQSQEVEVKVKPIPIFKNEGNIA